MRPWPLAIPAGLLGLAAQALVLAAEPSPSSARPVTLTGRVRRDLADPPGPAPYSLSVPYDPGRWAFLYPLVPATPAHRAFLDTHAGWPVAVRVSGYLTRGPAVLVIESLEESPP